MLPENQQINQDLEDAIEPSYTYGIDFEKGKIVGMIDGLEAVKQAALKILSTERFEYLIYSTDYGTELKGLIGQSPLFVQSEIKRRIREALTQDDRIESVNNFQFDLNSEVAEVTFKVHSEYGVLTMTQEVNV